MKRERESAVSIRSTDVRKYVEVAKEEGQGTDEELKIAQKSGEITYVGKILSNLSFQFPD